MTGSGVRCNLALAERLLVDPSLYILISEVEVQEEESSRGFSRIGTRADFLCPRQMTQTAAPKRSSETTQTQHNTAQHTNTQHNVHQEQLSKQLS